MVLRHVRDGATILARQAALIKRLAGLKLPTTEAEELLVLLERVQSEHLLHLNRLGGDLTLLTAKRRIYVQ